ncbi:2,3-bisphosphoglycerate-independent phosphoglycerate mutase [uncultured delta proteobacterium]|uniref:2,3-bisphosphoglycerate-independent phosphoglycerate mutase n=1 Tax=uncultured delta proteobacterium TaxID=34034 RepID=A0A212J4Q7_9DELT|nr:2,3-bisphosphoglycerate-independent phosphoglycerate mutase [uncultured delta proteobacterium]
MNNLTPTVLLILDGWGIAPAGPGNAASLADTPAIDSIFGHPSCTAIEASGRAVGLPAGYMGNSEVGHMNLGAGRIVYQDMTLIEVAMEKGEFAANPVISDVLGKTKASGGAVHCIGLLSNGGVHSHIDHVKGLLDAAKIAGVPAFVHAFMDGRDTSPTSGAGFIRELLDHMEKIGHGKLATMIGRYYAMDRDKHWERNILAWNAMVHGEGKTVENPVEALKKAYANDETDEFLKPRIVVAGDEAPHCIADNDGLFFFNFRADRSRQLTKAFHEKDFTEFERGNAPKLAAFATFTPYDSSIPVPAAFTKPEVTASMGEIVATLGLQQLRIAETEKYAHVTYFFSCGREDKFPGEERRLIPSPRDVATYDRKPEMSAYQVAETFVEEWRTGKYGFAVCNLANPDMVGHTGIIPAGIKACEAVDACAKKIVDAVLASNGRVLVTADHGNIEELLTEDGKPMTAHTTNLVPLAVLDNGPVKKLRPGGKLGDVSPTILHLWGAAQPEAMTGKSLWEEA